MCKTGLAETMVARTITAMQRRRGSNPGWIVALCGFGVALTGCAGGQTGDNGNGGGDNCWEETGRRPLSAKEADDAGFAVSQAIDALVAGRTGDGQTVWLTAPPTLWLDVGATPPPDRSLEAQLFVETSSIEELTYDCYTGQRSELEVSVDLRLETAEPSGTLRGRGSMLLSKDALSSQGAWAAVGIDGFEHDRYCVLSSQAADKPALSCDYIWASSECLASTTRSTQPAVPRTQLSVNELTALANAASPLALECEDGRTVTAAFELRVPESYCGENDTGWTPAVLSVAVEDLGLLPGSRSARLAIGSKAQCFERGDCVGGLCLDDVTEEEHDAGANCAAVTVLAAPSVGGNGPAILVTIQIDNDGRKLVRVVVAGTMGEGGYSPHCSGWSELE